MVETIFGADNNNRKYHRVVSHCRERDQFKLESTYSNLLAKYTMALVLQGVLYNMLYARYIQFWKREKKIAFGLILFETFDE